VKKEEQCAKCGACSVVCPIFQVTGRESHSPRGRMHLLKKLSTKNASPVLTNLLSQCLLCGACQENCPRGVDIPKIIIKARQELPTLVGEHPYLKFITQKLLGHPTLLAGAVMTKKFIDKKLLDRLPPESGLRLKLGMLGQPTKKTTESKEPKHLQPDPEKAQMAYFTGCHALHLEPEVSEATANLFSESRGLASPNNQTCCGLAAHSAGDLDEAKRLAKKNINAFEGNNLPILTSCGSCFAHLADYPKLFSEDDPWYEKAQNFANRLEEFSTVFNRLLEEQSEELTHAQSPQRVFYHDPCHLRFGQGITKAPRELLGRLPGVTLVELPNGAQCCGQGGLFTIAHPEMSRKISQQLIDSFNNLKVDVVVTTCSGCLLQWQQLKSVYKLDIEVAHLAIFLARYEPVRQY